MKAFLDMTRRNDHSVRERVTGKLAPNCKRTRPLGTWDCRKDLVLRQDMPAPPMEPYSGAVALLCEARGLQIDARHADEDVAGLQPHDDRIVQYSIEHALACPGHQPRQQLLPRDPGQSEREQRYMTLVRKPKTLRPGSWDIGIESHMMAERVQLSCEIEDVKSASSRNGDIKLSRHRLALWLGSLCGRRIRVAASSMDTSRSR